MKVVVVAFFFFLLPHYCFCGKDEIYVSSTDSLFYKNRLRTSFVLGMLSEPRIGYERMINQYNGFGFTIGYRRTTFITGLGYFKNPDMLMCGLVIYFDHNFYFPKENPIWFFAQRWGFRSLSINDWVGYPGQSAMPHWLVDRKRQDIVFDLRIGKVLSAPSQRLLIDFSLNPGLNLSSYSTQFREYQGTDSLVSSPESQFHWPKNGWYILPEIRFNLNIGIQW